MLLANRNAAYDAEGGGSMTLTLQTTVRAPLGEAPNDLTEAAIVARFTGGAYPSTIVARFAASVLLHARQTRIRASIVAAQIAKETGNFRFGGQVAPSQFSLAGIGATNDGAAGVVATSIEVGVAMVFAHHLNYQFGAFAKWPAELRAYQRYAVRNAAVVGAGYGGVVRIVGDFTNGRWAYTPTIPVGSLDNGYARGIVDIGNALLAASAAKGGSVAVPKPTVSSKPSPNRNGYGSPHDPKAICLHITAGSGASALSWLTSPASQASANYVNMEDGTVHELVPPTESAWANGAVNKPNLSNPIVAATLAAGRNMNTATISIENAGQTSGGKGGSLSAAQVRSLIALCAWLCQRFGIPADRDHIIPHAYVDSVNRPYCPGFSEAEWSSWVGQIAALVNGTSGKVPLTPVQQVIQEGIVAKFVEKSGEGVDYGINEAGMPFTVIRWGGTANKVDGVNINDIGISVYDADNKLEDRSIQGGAFKPWALRGK